jgi:hypothetical protein
LLVVRSNNGEETHASDGGVIFVLLGIAGPVEIKGDVGAGFGQIAPSDQPVAAIVAGADEDENLLAGDLPTLLDSPGHGGAGLLHHLRIGVAGRIGGPLRGDHLGYAKDFDDHGAVLVAKQAGSSKQALLPVPL